MLSQVTPLPVKPDKQEQEKLNESRMAFNQAKVNEELQKGTKKMFGKMFKKGAKTEKSAFCFEFFG